MVIILIITNHSNSKSPYREFWSVSRRITLRPSLGRGLLRALYTSILKARVRKHRDDTISAMTHTNPETLKSSRYGIGATEASAS